MIELVEISINDFKSSFDRCQKDKKWFYDVLSSCNTSKFNLYSIQIDNFNVGLIVNYKEIDENEFGICIFDEFRRKGYATQLVALLQFENNNNAIFTINVNNVISKFFFKKLVGNKILSSHNLNFN